MFRGFKGQPWYGKARGEGAREGDFVSKIYYDQAVGWAMPTSAVEDASCVV